MGDVMNCKRKGTKNEHRSIAVLEAEGYCCTRAAASLGVFDIIAIGTDDIILCQVKSNEWPRSVEMTAISAFLAPANCRRIIHRWRDGQSEPDIKEVAGDGHNKTQPRQTWRKSGVV